MLFYLLLLVFSTSEASINNILKFHFFTKRIFIFLPYYTFLLFHFLLQFPIYLSSSISVAYNFIFFYYSTHHAKSNCTPAPASLETLM